MTSDATAAGLDHLVLGCASLEAGCATIGAQLGTELVPGGRHPGGGTRNALLGLGRASYLELIAPDPDQSATPAARALAAFDEPVLWHWAVRSPRLDAVREQAQRDELAPGPVIPGRRQTDSGAELAWSLLFFEGAGVDATVPFCIDWQGTRPPGEALPARAELAALRVAGPLAPAVNRLLAAAGTSLSVSDGDGAGLAALIACEGRQLAVGAPQPVPRGLHGLWK
ncbi:MAG: VOC family protein [Pseudomonadota bacterium]